MLVEKVQSLILVDVVQKTFRDHDVELSELGRFQVRHATHEIAAPVTEAPTSGFDVGGAQVRPGVVNAR